MPAIQPADLGQRQMALELLLAEDSNGRDNAQQFANLMDRGELDPRGLLIISHGGEVSGVILSQVLPGKMGVVWPPRLAPSENEDASQSLIQTALLWLSEHGISLVQALVRLNDHAGIQRLMSHGFQRLADLVYLVWLSGDNADVFAAHHELQFLSYSAELHARFANVIQRSYESTLDCPALNGRRSIDDVMEGYRATGEFSAERWNLIVHDARDVGCLLLTDHPYTKQWELVYMGLVPEARGRGWGWKLVQHAQQLTRAAGRSALAVAVDSGNLPALRVYRGCGFIVLDSRRALVYELTRDSHARGRV